MARDRREPGGSSDLRLPEVRLPSGYLILVPTRPKGE